MDGATTLRATEIDLASSRFRSFAILRFVVNIEDASRKDVFKQCTRWTKHLLGKGPINARLFVHVYVSMCNMVSQENALIIFLKLGKKLGIQK